MEGPHPTVPSVKMAGTLASYMSNYKFHFKFNLKLKIVNFNKKSYMSFQLYTDRCICCMLFNLKFYTRLPVFKVV